METKTDDFVTIDQYKMYITVHDEPSHLELHCLSLLLLLSLLLYLLAYTHICNNGRSQSQRLNSQLQKLVDERAVVRQ